MSAGSYGRSDREGLIRAYDEEENTGFGLTDLASESDEDAPPPRTPNGKIYGNGNANASKRSFVEPAALEDRRSISRKASPLNR